MTLCDRFSNLDPIKLRGYKACEVFKLITRLSKYNKRKNKSKTKVIRKPAGDDWF